jgi:hypothetical protein
MRKVPRYSKNALLNHTFVRRRGVTAKEWCGHTDIIIASRPKTPKDQRALKFHFSIPSKGGGETVVEMLIGPEDFRVLLAFMSATDQEATLQAMTAEMHYQICRKPELLAGSQNPN